MKQSEKLDIILQFLYKKKFDGSYYNVRQILLDSEIQVNTNEANALESRLVTDGYVDPSGTEENSGSVCLTTHGVDYVENDSYTYKGQSVITNHYNVSVTGSTNANIVQNSSNFSISQSANQVEEAIEKIRNQLKNESIQPERIQDIEDCMAEIKASVSNNTKPKFSFKELLAMTSDVSSLGSLIVSLGQLIGLQ